MALDGAERRVSSMWMIGAVKPADATCRGCEQPLYRRGDYWEGPDGVVVCVKLRLEDISPCLPAYVYHEPLPAGLRGAPA